MLRTIAVVCCLPMTAQALTLEMPGAPVISGEETLAIGTLTLPTSPWNGQRVPSEQLTGALAHRAYQSETLFRPDAVAATILPQLKAQGYALDLLCSDRQCGGFDFRFALPVLPPPEMYVDLGNFVFISARKGDDRGVWVLISRSSELTHIQVSSAAPPDVAAVELTPNETPIAPLEPVVTPSDLAGSLEAEGRVILSDLVFQTGSSKLDGTSFMSLEKLAEYLSANPKRTIALVGHTDAVGSLDGNIALSKKRANAVRSLFLRAYEIAPERVAAQGMGYLAPVANNTTDTGRDQNRRVEAIITSTD